MPADELQHLLYEKSGLLGVSGLSAGLPGDNQLIICRKKPQIAGLI
jgi:acetate kinase